MKRNKSHFLQCLRTGLILAALTLSGCQTVNKEHSSSSKIGEGFLPQAMTNYESALPQLSDDDSSYPPSTDLLVKGNDLALKPMSSTKRSWAKKGGDITLNFSNIPVESAAQLIIVEQLGQSFTIEEGVSGLLSLNGQGGLHTDDLIPVFNVLLSSIDAKVVEVGDAFKIVKGSDNRSIHNTSGLDIIPLRYVSAEDFSRILASHGLLSTVMSESNMVAINGSPNKLRDVRKLVKTFDVNWFKGQSIGVFAVKNGSAKEVRSQLIEGFSVEGQNSLGSAKIVTVPRNNSLMVVAPSQSVVRQVGSWIKEIDRDTGGNSNGFYIYRVKNGKASELAKLAKKMFAVTGGSADDENSSSSIQLVQNEANLSNDVRVIADNSTNSVIVSGAPHHFKRFREAMKQLDTRPLQVLVEARIMELSLSGDLRYGLEWYLKGSRANSVTSGSLDFDTSGPDLLVPGFNYVVERAGDIRGVLSAFADDSRLKVLSSPSLLVLNNRKARIQVGDEVPIPQVQSVSNFAPEAPTVNSIVYRDTGIVLEITPRINEGGMVTLDVTQEVSSVGRNTVSDIDAPVIQQRKLSSTIAVENGQTVVLGGLIQERSSTNEAGIPVLKNIPAVGKLFSSTGEGSTRTELVALLTPRVLERDEDFAKINQEYIDSFQGLKEIYMGKQPN
ncbi:MAG: type II secretion system secretin GspD [Gammaproteobacteria bacterium]|nr:type II secretion system secretin GspD [Gammaproteobacteria bacterium]